MYNFVINMDDILKYALEHEIIDLSYVQDKVEMSKRQELLKQHPYKIWKGDDGYYHTYIPDKESKNGRIAKKRKNKKDVEDDVIFYLKQDIENPTIKEVFDEWNDRRLRLEKISIPTYQRNKQLFNRHYSEFGKKRIKNITEEDIGNFLEEQIPKFNLTAKSFANLKTITRGLLKRAKKRKLINFFVEETLNDLDVTDSEFKKVIKEDYEEVFNEDEMPVIMEYLEKNLDITGLGILLMFVTGARIGEVVTLKHSDFDGNTFKIRRTETRYRGDDGKYVYDVKEFPKTHAGLRTVIIPQDYSWIVRKLKAANPFEEYIFMKNGNRITAAAMRSKLMRVCDKLHIYRKSPHKIRKTYGTILLDNNIDQKLIIGQMGHTDISCTENHYHRNRRTIEKKSEIISKIPEFCVK